MVWLVLVHNLKVFSVLLLYNLLLLGLLPLLASYVGAKPSQLSVLQRALKSVIVFKVVPTILGILGLASNTTSNRLAFKLVVGVGHVDQVILTCIVVGSVAHLHRYFKIIICRLVLVAVDALQWLWSCILSHKLVLVQLRGLWRRWDLLVFERDAHMHHLLLLLYQHHLLLH